MLKASLQSIEILCRRLDDDFSSLSDSDAAAVKDILNRTEQKVVAVNRSIERRLYGEVVDPRINVANFRPLHEQNGSLGTVQSFPPEPDPPGVQFTAKEAPDQNHSTEVKEQRSLSKETIREECEDSYHGGMVEPKRKMSQPFLGLSATEETAVSNEISVGFYVTHFLRMGSGGLNKCIYYLIMS